MPQSNQHGPMRLIILLCMLVSFLVPVANAQLLPGLPAEEVAAASAPADPSIDALIKIIENDATREQLLERLRAGDVPAVDGTTSTAEAPTQDLSIARQLAEYTRDVAEGTSSTFKAIGQAVNDVVRSFSGTSSDLDEFRQVALSVLLVAVGMYASFLMLRVVVVWLQGRISNRVTGRRWIAKLLGLIGATALDLGAVLAAWAIGYVLALNVVGGPTGRMGINQTLLLNAFILVEIIKVGVRLVFEPHQGGLRVLKVSDTTSAYWSFWLGRIVSLIGYCFMFVAPIIAAYVSRGAAEAVQVLAMTTAVIIGILVVMQNKDRVRNALSSRAKRGHKDAFARSAALFGHYWHLLAIAYLVTLLIVWLTNAEEALPFMLGATVQSVISVVVGMLIITFISRFIRVGVQLPNDIRERLPLLETRLHTFVPKMMQIVRTVVILGVVLAIARAWGVFDVLGWMASDDGQQIAGSVISAVIIVVIGIVLHVGMSSWVEYKLNPNFGSVPTSREKTLLSLFRNAFTVTLLVFVTMLALAQIGVNIAPLLAGAGVLGLAIGFGAQKLVQDIITGAFIQFENVMNEGDVVEAGGKSGVVERLTIRSVSIRSLDGTLHLIPFSSVEQVSNMMRGFSFHLAEIGVAYRENIPEVKEAMFEAFRRVQDSVHKDAIIGEFDMQGVIAFTDSAVVVRARIRTLPGGHWAVGRYFNEKLKEVFDERGIEMPFAAMNLYMGTDKKGRAAPLHIVSDPAVPSALQGEDADPAREKDAPTS